MTPEGSRLKMTIALKISFCYIINLIICRTNLFQSLLPLLPRKGGGLDD